MNKTVVLIGVGEIGGVFAKGVLKLGYPVYPVVRGKDLREAVGDIPDPQAVIISVGEKDIYNLLESIPQSWKDKLVLVQNELLPRDWITRNIDDPTVISVWFEKKRGQDAKVIIPSPVFGPLSDLVQQALSAIDIECHVLENEEQLCLELVLKNVYILTVNIAGLLVGGTVGELWSEHQELARQVADDVMDIQFRLIEKDLDRGQLIEGMVKAFNGDLDHKCMGRSAPVRLKRAIVLADELGLEVKKLREINSQKDQVSV